MHIEFHTMYNFHKVYIIKLALVVQVTQKCSKQQNDNGREYLYSYQYTIETITVCICPHLRGMGYP